jgi:hypothetical protein
MKILNQIGHQGDTQWYTIDEIPKEAKKINKQFIAASEKTGNVHALSGNYDLYEYEDGFIVDVKNTSILNHTAIQELNEKTWNNPNVLPMKDHKPSEIKKGTYFVGIQRKFNPLSKLMEKVRD